jgi:uncharacterized protein (TIGR02118 family)
MTVSYFVRYEVEAPEEFIRHYRDRHVPILARWPGMRRILLHTDLKVKDPFQVNPGKALLVAQLEFESQADLERALESPQRAEARRDFQEFPPCEGKVFHQAMRQEEVYRSPWLDANEEEA